jgi:predicted glycoside hydrolase/deacetylase ChbG (UPF0249 family)
VDTSSSELLGFPPDARLLILNNDDFGMYRAVNAAVVDSIESGIAASCSLMVPCPGASHAMTLLHERPDIAFGIHLTLVCEMIQHRWGPATDAAKVPSLVDETGALFSSARIPELLAQARIKDVEREFRAQIDAVLDDGLAPTHLDWHCLADGGRADIFDLTVTLADEYGLAVRAWLDPAREGLRARGVPVIDHRFLDSFSVDGTVSRYVELLRDLPVGLSEWALHPSQDTNESRAIDPGHLVRHRDYEFLTSPEARDVVRREGIVVIGYDTIQQAVV